MDYLWIIVMFLSAVRTLILTAARHPFTFQSHSYAPSICETGLKNPLIVFYLFIFMGVKGAFILFAGYRDFWSLVLTRRLRIWSVTSS